nr:hypothetical protein [Tanacetum cinerariifolium]
RFQELALLRGRMFSEEADKIEKYVGGLPDMIHGSVVASRPKTMQEADREIMRDPEREVGYGITDSWDEIVETLQGAPVSIDTELGGYVREFETRVRQDTDEIYMRLDDEQTERQLLAGRLNMLFRDRRAHAYTRHLMELEARMSREAWVRATDASDLVHGEVMSLRTTVLDHRRSTKITELRTALQGQVTALQGQVTALQEQVTTLQGQQGLAGGPTQPELPEEAGGICHVMVRIFRNLTAHDALRSMNGDDSHNSETGVRRTERATRKCTYIDFLKCQPLPYKGTKGKTLMKMMTKKYCPRNEIRKLEMELWDLKIEKYVGGLPDMIHGSVVASKPKTMQEAIEIATELMDKKIHTFAERETARKRKFKNTSRNTQNQQQHSNKRQNTGRV